MRRGERDREKEGFWRGAIGRQRVSGRSVREFCRIEGLSEPSFYSWRRELSRRADEAAARRSRQSVAAFVPLVVPETPPETVSAQPPAPIEIVFADGTRVCVPAGCDGETLAVVVAALAAHAAVRAPHGRGTEEGTPC